VNILLTGGNGFIGSHLLRALTARGHSVRVCVRAPAAAAQGFPGPQYIRSDFSTDVAPEQWRERLGGIDFVINAVGIIRETGNQRFDTLHRDAPIALFQAAVECGVRRIIQISALGADDSAQSYYHLSKRAADDFLSELPLEWVILRPSIVYGAGAKSMALFRALAALPLTPIVADGQQPVQPIHIDDLVEAVVQSLESDQVVLQRIDLAGPQPVTMRELLQQQRQWLGLGKLHTLSVPYRMTLAFAGVAGFLGTAPINTETVEMLQRGNTGDTGDFISHFGFRPRRMEEALAHTPATVADRWYAGLYFLRPLLRLSLAFVWIITGLTSAFFYPTGESYLLLAKTGIHGTLAPLMLYGGAGLDLLLGLALLFSYRLHQAALLQIVIMILYSLIISVALPEFWLHPFGPVSKNLPLIVATLTLIVMEKR
jgi:uncharacterized protein YbjT (DUF2867 family)